METVLEGTKSRPMPPNLGKGFRPPFDSQTGRIAGLKSVEARRLQREALEALTRVPEQSDVEALKCRLTLLRQVQTRLLRLALANKEADAISKLLDCQRELFDQEQRLLRRDSGEAGKVKRQSNSNGSAANVQPSALEPIGAQPTQAGSQS